MTDTRITEAEYTSMNTIDQTSETATDFRRTITSAEQDYPGTRYYPNWSKWFGYYKVTPDIHAVIDNIATWAVGRGVKADKKTEEKLKKIKGCGVDSYNSIMKNQVRTAAIVGDSFAEIVRNTRGEIKNIKPISPGSMVIKSNRFGIIDGYEQITLYNDEKSGQKARKTIKFKPTDVFHLAWNRLGDEPHGRSMIEPIEEVISMKNEAAKDMRVVFHRYVKPLIVSSVDTDDANEIAAFKLKLDKAVENMENLIVPKDTVDMERISIPQYSTLDPIPWLRTLQEYFVSASGVPEVILGYGRETTEASAKILYLAFQQTIEDIQLWLEEQNMIQMKLKVEFEFPENIGPEMAMDIQKERNLNNMSETGGGNLNAVSRNSGRPGQIGGPTPGQN